MSSYISYPFIWINHEIFPEAEPSSRLPVCLVVDEVLQLTAGPCDQSQQAAALFTAFSARHHNE